ncbi:MAG: hypothetical protein WC495_04190 [Patescibacteria group bacterium]|jgi:hypothetical protein
MLSFIHVAQAVEATSQSTSLLGTVDWSHPSWDLFIILFFVIAAFLYGLSLGRDRIIVILVSIYMSLAVATNAPFLRDIGFQQNINNTLQSLFFVKISMFLFVFILLFFLLSRSALLKTIGTSDDSGRWWHVILFSFLHVGLIISIVLSFLPPDAVNNLSPLMRQIFTSDIGRFIWIVGPILAMIVIRGKSEKKFKYDM